MVMLLNEKKFSKIIDTDFSDGTLQQWRAEALNENSVNVVNNPDGTSGKCVRLHINYNEDFSGFLTGTPRAAIVLDYNKFHYEINNEYLIKFKTFLPLNFQYETTYSNPFAFFDMHTTRDGGSSPNMIQIDKSSYQFKSNIDMKFDSSDNLQKLINIYSITNDLGVWVSWINFYRPSYSLNGRSIIWKDGNIIFDYKGFTAYRNTNSYQKFQMYKWDWKVLPTDTTDEVIYIKDIEIYKGSS